MSDEPTTPLTIALGTPISPSKRQMNGARRQIVSFLCENIHSACVSPSLHTHSAPALFPSPLDRTIFGNPLSRSDGSEWLRRGRADGTLESHPGHHDHHQLPGSNCCEVDATDHRNGFTCCGLVGSQKDMESNILSRSDGGRGGSGSGSGGSGSGGSPGRKNVGVGSENEVQSSCMQINDCETQPSSRPPMSKLLVIPEIRIKIISHFTGKTLLAFSSTSHLFKSVSDEWWKAPIEKKIQKLKTFGVTLHLRTETLTLKYTYLVLRKYFKDCYSALCYLKQLEEDKLTRNKILNLREQVENIFHSKLYRQPWVTLYWKQKFQNEVKVLKQEIDPDTSICETQKLGEIIVFLKIKEGFYRGEIIKFNIQVNEHYPFTPPSVLCTSPDYNPFVNSNSGEVTIDLLNFHWNPSLHSITHIIQRLRDLFTKPTILTSNFNL